jgi:hypothetical protein
MGIFGIENRSTQGHVSIKWYGNFGGPGYGDDTKTPLDKLDEAYQQHDHGYGKRGYFDAQTDLIYSGNTAAVLIEPNSSWDARLHGAAAVGIFGLTTPISGLATTAVNPVVSAYGGFSHGGFVDGIENLVTSPVTQTIGVIQEVGGVVSNVAGAIGHALGSIFG